jgi:hypothetical protein
MDLIRRRAFLEAAVVILALIAALAQVPAGVVERWYSTLLYPAEQRVLTPFSKPACPLPGSTSS